MPPRTHSLRHARTHARRYWTISQNVFSNASFCLDDCQWLHIWTSSIHDINTTGCFTDTATQDVKGTNTPVTNTTLVPKDTPVAQWPADAQRIMSGAGPADGMFEWLTERVSE